MALPKFKSPVIQKRIALAKTVVSGGGTDRPADWKPPEEQQQQSQNALSTPSTPEEVIGAATGQQPIVTPSTVKQDAAVKPLTGLKKTEPEVITKEEFTQESYEVWKDIETTKTTMEQQTIDPNKVYIIPDKTRKTQIVPGFIVQPAQKKIIQDLTSAEIGSQKIWQQSLGWHPETKITKTSKGYDISFPYAGAEKYSTYKRQLEQGGIGGLFATSWTPEDPLGIVSAYYTATGEKQKAIDVKIKSLHHVSSIKSLPDFGKWYLEMPSTQIGLSVVGGYGIGKATGYAAGRLSGSVIGSRALSIGGLAVGTALTVPAVIDIKTTWESGRRGEALGKATMFGLIFGGGIGGYKTGIRSTSGVLGRGKGLTTYEMGAKKAYLSGLEKSFKTGEIDIIRFSRGSKAVKGYYKIKQDIRIRGLKPLQGDITLENVATFEKTPFLRNWFRKQPTVRRSEIFGGAASDKPSTHDIDIMYRSALGAAESKQASRILGYGKVESYADIKPWQRVGSQVGKMGTLKQTSYQHPSGLRGMKFTEQFMRLGESSLDLAHPGRVKDIPEALRMLDLIYTRSGGVPSSMTKTVKMYQFGMRGLEKTPIIMKPSTSAYIYGGGLGKKIYTAKVGFYEKILPSSYFKGKVAAYTGIPDVKPPTGLAGGFLPPSPSVSFIPSAFLGGLSSSAFAGFKSSVYPSSSFIRSISASGYSPSKYISKSLTSISPSVYPSRFIRSDTSYKFTPSIKPSVIPDISPSISPKITPSITPSISPKILPSISPVVSKSKSISSVIPKTSSVISKSTYSYPESVFSGFYYGIPSSLIGMGGAGGNGWGEGFKRPRYRFRMFKVGSIKNILKEAGF